MEITVYQRIKAYIDDNRISLNALAKTLNMNQSTVLRQVKGEQTLSSTLVENFLKAYPDVSAMAAAFVGSFLKKHYECLFEHCNLLIINTIRNGLFLSSNKIVT